MHRHGQGQNIVATADFCVEDMMKAGVGYSVNFSYRKDDGTKVKNKPRMVVKSSIPSYYTYNIILENF